MNNDQTEKIVELNSDETQERVLRQTVARLTVDYSKSGDRKILADLDAAKAALSALAAGGWFRSAQDAGRWIAEQGYMSSRGNAVTQDVARKLVETIKKDPKRGYSRKLVKQAADMKWGANAPPEVVEVVDDRKRLLKYMADERGLKVKQLQGGLLDAAEEEARDTAILLGIRRHLEVSAPDRAKMLISSVSDLLTDEQRGRLTARLPELIEQDMETIADIFDRLAQAGGVEA